MPTALQLPGVRRARIWLDETPAIRPLTGERSIRSYVARPASVIGSYSVAAEVMIPRGPRSLYGLLGISFTPARDGICRVSIPDTTDEPIADPNGALLGMRSDRYAVGLPSEYADGVFDAAATLEHAGVLEPGLVDVRWAVHGEASSSLPMFRYLASALIRLVAIRPRDEREPDVVAMFEEPLH